MVAESKLKSGIEMDCSVALKSIESGVKIRRAGFVDCKFVGALLTLRYLVQGLGGTVYV